jgi:hypothetical protein
VAFDRPSDRRVSIRGPSKAAEYYGRALEWIGIDAGKLDEGVLPQVDEEWTPLLKNYIRVKSASVPTI